MSDDRAGWMPPPSEEWQRAHGWKDGQPPPGGNGRADDSFAGLAEVLAAPAWMQRDLPPPERLLGDLLTTTSRVFLVGQTGLGKTMLGLAIAAGMALGTGFLHWRAARPARVLYLDGEMPAELLQARVHDAARRAGCGQLLDTLFIYSRDWAEALAKRYPMLGTLEPLNTEQGQNFIRLLCDIVRPDAVIFDNVQALIVGDMKDEVPWTDTLPLVASLTTRRIGQVWLDHTGHNIGRQYGSATKAWRFDAVGIMSPLADDERAEREVAFTLSFDPPGKARRRTPDNWEEFAPQVIRLRDDHWTSEPAEAGGAAAARRSRTKVKPSVRLFHDALLDAIGHAGTRPGETTLEAWERECIRRGFLERIEPGDSGGTRHAKRSMFRTAKSDLQAAGLIGISDDRVMDRSRDW